MKPSKQGLPPWRLLTGNEKERKTKELSHRILVRRLGVPFKIYIAERSIFDIFGGIKILRIFAITV
jgi:hypothetical protein